MVLYGTQVVHEMNAIRLKKSFITDFNELLGRHSECDPPEPISNSEVKPLSADDSVGFPYVKVGHCQASYI